MPASEYRALEVQVRELHRVLGKKAVENEPLRVVISSKAMIRAPYSFSGIAFVEVAMSHLPTHPPKDVGDGAFGDGQGGHLGCKPRQALEPDMVVWYSYTSSDRCQARTGVSSCIPAGASAR